MRSILLVSILLTAMVAGCADQSAISNRTNHFSYAGQAADKDTAETYSWDNTLGKAKVDWAGQVGRGAILVTITDAAGAQVFSRSITEGQQDAFSSSTGSGVAGDWTITMTFSDYTGQLALDIRAQAGSSTPSSPWP